MGAMDGPPPAAKVPAMTETPAASDWAAARGEKWRDQLAGMEAMLAPVDAPLATADFLIVGANTSSNRSITQALTTMGATWVISTETAFSAAPVSDLLAYRAVIYASSSSTGRSGRRRERVATAIRRPPSRHLTLKRLRQ